MKVQIKTEEQFESDGRWNEDLNVPYGWSVTGDMNHLIGKVIELNYNEPYDLYDYFDVVNEYTWLFDEKDFIKYESKTMNMKELSESLEMITILSDMAEYCVYEEGRASGLKDISKELIDFINSTDSVIDVEKIEKLLNYNEKIRKAHDEI